MKRRRVPSAPAEKTHGWVGWKATSSTPRSLVRLCPLSTFTGTSSGFCSRSLWGRERLRTWAAQSLRGWGGGHRHSLVHHPVADDDTAVVGARCEERVPGVEGHGPEGLLVVPEGGTRLRGVGRGASREQPATRQHLTSAPCTAWWTGPGQTTPACCHSCHRGRCRLGEDAVVGPWWPPHLPPTNQGAPSPAGCTARLDTHLQLGVSFLVSSWRSRW